MIILTTAVLVYITSIYGCYKYIQKSHYHEDGKWNLIKPDNSDILYMLVPLLNSWTAVEYMLGFWKQPEKRAVNFFKPKNK